MLPRPASALSALFALALSLPAGAAPSPETPRVIVLTDMEADPDDTQSLVRLLLYANDLDIRGLVATTSVHMPRGVHPESIQRVIDAYAQVLPNLRRHDGRYPDAARLRERVQPGQPGYGTAAVGPGQDTPGSELILRELARPDARPLWISVWGGANTLLQALQQLRTRTADAATLAQALGRLRVHAISDQDDAGSRLRREFPGLFYVVSPGGYGNSVWGAINEVVDGIDNTTISNAWLARHIQQGQGPLGAIYPDTAYGVEGDTPAFLGLIPNGLNVPDRPDWGGWGGRYELYTPRLEDTDPKGFTGGVPVEAETRPIWTNASDRHKPFVAGTHGRATRVGEREFTGPRVTLWRWREAVQHDFAARMRWTTQPYAGTNHPPQVTLAHAAKLYVRSGDDIKLDASRSTDPDGDSLSFAWLHYPEAGSWKTPIAIGTENLARIHVRAPDVTQRETAHFIVQVTDKGSPALTRYERIVVTIDPRR